MATQKYILTDEHRAQLAPWRDRWIANALSTKPMDEADRAASRIAIRGLYEAAGLTPPPDHRIVFVPSPFVMRFAGGFAAWIWWLRKNKKPATADATDAATADATADATYAATYAATDAATADATADATYAATYAATADATADATYAATYAATRAATADATYAATDAATAAATDAATRAATADATDAATRAATADATDAATAAATDAATRAATADATYAATRAATADATADATWYRLPLHALVGLARDLFGANAQAGLQCAYNAYQVWNGGNQYSAWVSYLSFFRHVARLPLDYAKWQHYEAAAVHAGPRLMHAEFCIVSDRPEVLKVDGQNRPHCDDGPFCRWRDGTALYAVHGTRVPWDIIERPESVTVERIKNEGNAEIRRVMIARMGPERYVKALGASKTQADDYGELYRVGREGDSDLVMVRCWNSTLEKDGTTKEYWLRVHPESRSAREGLARMIGLRQPQQYAPTVET